MGYLIIKSTNEIINIVSTQDLNLKYKEGLKNGKELMNNVITDLTKKIEFEKESWERRVEELKHEHKMDLERLNQEHELIRNNYKDENI